MEGGGRGDMGCLVLRLETKEMREGKKRSHQVQTIAIGLERTGKGRAMIESAKLGIERDSQE